MTQLSEQALEVANNRILCAAAQAVIERDYRPRPGRSSDTAPDGQRYIPLKTRFYGTAGEAVRELEGQLRALNVASQGDTVWWRVKPAVEFEIQNRKWQARTRLALGWARDEKPEHMPNSGFPGAYPLDGAGDAPAQPGLGGQLPTWKCHKVVQADKIVGFSTDDRSGMMKWKLLLDGGVEVTVGNTFLVRVPAGDPVGGYYVRYRDGYESWSPAKEFEDGYTRQTL